MSAAFRVNLSGQSVQFRFQNVSFDGVRAIVSADVSQDINARAAKAQNLADLNDRAAATNNLLFSAGDATDAQRTVTAKLRDMRTARDSGVTDNVGANQTVAMQAAADVLGGFGVMQYPSGYAYGNIVSNGKVGLIGAGPNATVLRASDTSKPIWTITASLNWIYVPVENLTFAGLYGQYVGDGVRFGREPLVSNDDIYAGSTSFRNVRFEWLDTCIKKAGGNLGVSVTDCGFAEANYHIMALGVDATGAHEMMHGGCFTVTGGEFHGAAKASIYIDSPQSGTGQVIVDGAIFEGNPGHVFYIKNFNDVGPQPSLIIRNCWNEANGTGGNVTIGLDTQSPKFLYAEDCSRILIENTPVGPIKLVNSTVVLRNCNTDLLTIEKDADSAVIIEGRSTDANGTFVKELTSSWDVASRPSPALQAANMTHFGGFSGETGGNVLLAEKGISAISTSAGATTPVANGGIRGEGRQDLTISALSTVGAGFNLTAGKYLVAVLEIGLASGTSVTPLLTGAAGIGDFGAVTSSVMQTRVMMGKVASSLSGMNVYLSPTGSCNVKIGAIAVVEFDTRQEAIDFLRNRRLPLP